MPHKPLPFGDVFGRVSMQIPGNRTVMALANAFDQMKVAKALSAFGQERFINLVEGPNAQGAIAVTLYAGDGIVTKVTDAGYVGNTMLPFVVPAFASVHVPMELGPGVVIQSFPYLPRPADQQHIEQMRAQMRPLGLYFAEQDDRPDNARLLVDNTPASVDGDAIRVQWDANAAVLQPAAKAWHEKFKKIYPVLYAEGFRFQQQSFTDFRLADPPSMVVPAHRKETKEKPRSRWFGFFHPA
ncbi:MAG: hypothetical protein KBA75_03480 [Alphaproteobacteria bacterium]|nr:hypothetical protein [Alphaproteobacteria bacterium]